MIGGRAVNYHLSQKVGSKDMLRILHQKFKRAHFKRKDEVVSLATEIRSTKMQEAKVAIDHLVLILQDGHCQAIRR